MSHKKIRYEAVIKSKTMARLLFAILFLFVNCYIAFASTVVYRLERDTETENLAIVGVDGVKRPVCIMSPEQYELMTSRFERVWNVMNAKEESRILLHGKRDRQVVEGNTKSTIYADGFVYHEKMIPKTLVPRATVVTNRTRSGIIRTKPNGISERQWKMRERLRKIKESEPKTVTVEHDAVTGKDVVK